jgi:hypothetical protein
LLFALLSLCCNQQEIIFTTREESKIESLKRKHILTGIMLDGSHNGVCIDDTISGSFSFDPDCFLEGTASQEEQTRLRHKLLRMYAGHARALGKQLQVMTDPVAYAGLKKSGELLAGNDFYLLMDTEKNNVLDMRPVVQILQDTDEAFYYSCTLPPEGNACSISRD